MMDLISRGGPVMYFLVILSVVVLAFIAERILFWVTDMRRFKPGETEAFLGALRQKRLGHAWKLGSESHDPVVRTLFASLSHGPLSLRDALSIEIERTVDTTRRSLVVIDTAVTLAPLMGIFGTVTGIIHSFEFMGDAGGPNPYGVTGGIAQALIATATGLCIAMPSLVFFNFFQEESDKFALRTANLAAEFEGLLATLIQDAKAGPLDAQTANALLRSQA